MIDRSHPFARPLRRHWPQLGILLGVTALAISACQRPGQTSETPAPQTTAAQTTEGSAAAVPAPEKAAPQAAAASTAPERPAATTPRRQLVLSVSGDPADAAASAGEGALDPQQRHLPDLFAADKPESKVAMSGALLTKPGEERLLDSVNGAEVSIEIKTR